VIFTSGKIVNVPALVLLGAEGAPDKDSLLLVAGTVHEEGIDILVREIIGPAAVSKPSVVPGTGGLDAGTATVSVQVIISVMVKVLLVAVPIFSIPPAVFAPALVKVSPAAGTGVKV